MRWIVGQKIRKNWRRKLPLPRSNSRFSKEEQGRILFLTGNEHFPSKEIRGHISNTRTRERRRSWRKQGMQVSNRNSMRMFRQTNLSAFFSASTRRGSV